MDVPRFFSFYLSMQNFQVLLCTTHLGMQYFSSLLLCSLCICQGFFFHNPSEMQDALWQALSRKSRLERLKEITPQEALPLDIFITDCPLPSNF